MDSSQLSTWKVHTSDRRQEFIPINKQLLSELCNAFGLVLAKPSPNKLICFSYAVLLFVVEWRQNMSSRLRGFWILFLSEFFSDYSTERCTLLTCQLKRFISIAFFTKAVRFYETEITLIWVSSLSLHFFLPRLHFTLDHARRPKCSC